MCAANSLGCDSHYTHDRKTHLYRDAYYAMDVSLQRACHKFHQGRSPRGSWQSSLAVACIVEMKAGIAVVVGAAKTVGVVSRVDLKTGAAGAAGGIGAAKTVAVASGVELKVGAAGAAVGIETTETVAVVSGVELKAGAAGAVVGIGTTNPAVVAGVLLDTLRPHAGTGDTGLE